MSNVIELKFRDEDRRVEELHTRLIELMNEYSADVSLAMMIGILEMVKADALDCTLPEN